LQLVKKSPRPLYEGGVKSGKTGPTHTNIGTLINTKLTKLATMGAAATAIGAVGFFTVPAPAQAAPPCTQYGFGNAEFDLVQTNGYGVHLFPDGSNTSAATGTAFDATATNKGDVSGGVNGRNVDFTIRWRGGAQGRYTGTVSGDGFVHQGLTVDVANPGSGAYWDSTTPLVCLDAPAAPAPAPAPAPASAPEQVPLPPASQAPAAKKFYTTVKQANDVYDVPNVPEGKGKKIGVLDAGRQVEIIGSCSATDWNNAVVPDMPGGKGYAWGFVTC
jgi:hypothetical protein